MSKRMLLLLLVLGGSGIATTVWAQQLIYKWTDAQGQIQYTELPPASGVPYETVRKSGGAGPETSGTDDLGKQQNDLAKKLAEEDAKQQQQLQEQVQKQDEVRIKNCEAAKKNVEVLQGDRPVVKTDDKGNKVALDAQQREAELQRAKKDQDYYCNP